MQASDRPHTNKNSCHSLSPAQCKNIDSIPLPIAVGVRNVYLTDSVSKLQRSPQEIKF